jgi:hypothetical protein
MAITTTQGHVARALDFYDRTDVYFAYGRTSAWPNDVNGKPEGDITFQPPVEDIAATTLTELIAYKKVVTKNLVVPDANGTITYRSTKWKIVNPTDALAQGARWVYVQTELAYDEVPLLTYRQIGLFSRLVKKTSVPAGQLALLPTEVETSGYLEVLDNRKPVTRQVDQKEILELIVEF